MTGEAMDEPQGDGGAFAGDNGSPDPGSSDQEQ